LMEPEVVIKCRKSDAAVVERVLEEAADEYKKLMKAEVKQFKNKEVPCSLTLDQKRYLPEFNPLS